MRLLFKRAKSQLYHLHNELVGQDGIEAAQRFKFKDFIKCNTLTFTFLDYKSYTIMILEGTLTDQCNFPHFIAKEHKTQ